MINLFYNELIKALYKKRTYISFTLITLLIPVIVYAIDYRAFSLQTKIYGQLQDSFIFIGSIVNGFLSAYLIIAILITHIYSFANDMDKILGICKKNKILVIEDSAEVIGLKYKNKICGSFGDLSTFSFYANKQITTGEGGMISTNNKKLFEKCKSLRNLCFGKINRFSLAGGSSHAFKILPPSSLGINSFL